MSGPKKKIDGSGRVVQIIPGCIVCKTCEFTAPDVFIVKEKTLSAEVILEEPSEEMIPAVLEAIKNCPENVIKFRKKTTS